MKLFSLFLVVGICLTSCNSKYRIEEAMFDCMKEGFEEDGVDLDKKLENIEVELLENTILPTPDGDGYDQMLEKLSKKKDPIGMNIKLEKALESLMNSGGSSDLRCHPSDLDIDTTGMYKCKFKLVEYELIEFDTSPPREVIFTVMSDVIDAEDMNEPFYKLWLYYTLIALHLHQ